MGDAPGRGTAPIYERESAVVVVFVSAEYAERDWTRLERRAALAGRCGNGGNTCCPPVR